MILLESYLFSCFDLVFSLIIALNAYLILKLRGAALIGGQHLKEGGPYF